MAKFAALLLLVAASLVSIAYSQTEPGFVLAVKRKKSISVCIENEFDASFRFPGSVVPVPKTATPCSHRLTDPPLPQSSTAAPRATRTVRALPTTGADARRPSWAASA
jgi:hypothetical protein